MAETPSAITAPCAPCSFVGRSTSAASPIGIAPAPHPDNTFWFHTALDARLTVTQQREWYQLMQRRLGVLGLAVASHRSVSVVLGVRERVVRAHRHQVLSWLIEQPRVWAVQLGELLPLAEALVRGLPAHPVVDVTCVAGVPRCRLEGYAQQTLRAVVRKALAEREAKRLQGWAG